MLQVLCFLFMQLLVTYGGIKIILEALKAHTKNEEVQIDGCKALASLAFDTSLQKIIASFGGIEVIINAMIQHPEKCQVQAEDNAEGLMAVIKANPNTDAIGFEYADIKKLKV